LVKGNGREDSDLDLLVDAEPRFRDISVVEEIYLTVSSQRNPAYRPGFRE
jgi:predicted nucleotidyltransferase